jgi:hypothetical protein
LTTSLTGSNGLGCRYWGESGQNHRQRRRNRDRPPVGSERRAHHDHAGNALEQRGGRYGLQTMCEAGGMANATIIERLG